MYPMHINNVAQLLDPVHSKREFLQVGIKILLPQSAQNLLNSGFTTTIQNFFTGETVLQMILPWFEKWSRTTQARLECSLAELLKDQPMSTPADRTRDLRSRKLQVRKPKFLPLAQKKKISNDLNSSPFTTLDNISEDVIVCILSFLSPDGISTCCCLNKRLCDLELLANYGYSPGFVENLKDCDAKT